MTLTFLLWTAGQNALQSQEFLYGLDIWNAYHGCDKFFYGADLWNAYHACDVKNHCLVAVHCYCQKIHRNNVLLVCLELADWEVTQTVRTARCQSIQMCREVSEICFLTLWIRSFSLKWITLLGTTPQACIVTCKTTPQACIVTCKTIPQACIVTCKTIPQACIVTCKTTPLAYCYLWNNTTGIVTCKTTPLALLLWNNTSGSVTCQTAPLALLLAKQHHCHCFLITCQTTRMTFFSHLQYFFAKEGNWDCFVIADTYQTAQLTGFFFSLVSQHTWEFLLNTCQTSCLLLQWLLSTM